MATCRVLGERHISVAIRPEDTPINPSPWYAVKVTSKADNPSPVTVGLDYGDYAHRYWPKTSTDGETFNRVSADQLIITEDGRHAEVTLVPSPHGTYLAAQPIISVGTTRQWMDEIAGKHGLSQQLIGQSIDGQDVVLLQTSGSNSVGSLLLVSRQHPPEITGMLAYKAFVDTLLAETPLARNFRERYQIVMVPLINPDGVDAGYWRHNKGGLDLNRDWGPFTQPETKAVRDAIDRLDSSDETRPRFFLDFHSTRRNVFYTQEPGRDGTEQDWTSRWLERAEHSLVEAGSDYLFDRQGSHQPDRPTSKTYMHSRFDIPAITYEVGDETPIEALEAAAEVFAVTLMETMLSDK